MDQFRGIFRLTYAGDAHLVLRTKVQVRFEFSVTLASVLMIGPGKPTES